MAKSKVLFDDGSSISIDFDNEVKKIKKEMAYLLDSPLIPEELKSAIRHGLSKEETKDGSK